MPLRIAILGAGNIGSTFAFQLARIGNHDVTAIARPGSVRLQQLQRDGAIVSIDGERANVRVSDVLDEQIPFDLIIVTLLAHQIGSVLPALQRSTAKCIHFMFNTFEPERLRDAVGSERCAFGMPFVQAMIDKDGKIKAKIGAGGQKTKMSQQRWVDVFNASGLPAVMEPDMPLWLRCHVPLCVAFESVCAAGMRRGGGASWDETIKVARGIRESFTLIQGLGYQLYPKGKSRLSVFPVRLVALMLWLISRIKSFRELLASGENECRALVDVMMASAVKSKIPIVISRIAGMKPGQL